MRQRNSGIRLTLLLGLGVALGAGCGGREREDRTPDPASRRMTQSGPVVGYTGRYGSHAWLGIPYAKPPTGRLRWRAPLPADAWTENRVAVNPGSPCTQYASPIGGVAGAALGTPVGSEDCLALSVWAPRMSPADVPGGPGRFPVMVWIHGGGNSIGEAAFYDGGNLAMTQKLVVVALNYRLGPFGWFRHAALRDDDATPADQSGNFGTLDQIRALEWVRDNVGAFGGDPNNVTVFGESAGGLNVFALLVAPAAGGLFHRAIVESGALTTYDTATAENFVDDVEPGDPSSSNEAILRMLVADRRAAGRSEAKDVLGRMTDPQVEAYLRGKSNFDILRAYSPQPENGMIEMPKVLRDGVVLPVEEPIVRFGRADGYNRVPVLLGTNRDENKLFLFGDPAYVRRWLGVIFRIRDEANYTLIAEHLAKLWKAIGADEPATALAATQGRSVFVYRFDWDEEPRILGADLSVMLGAAHGFEIPFVFGHFDLGKEGNRIFTAANAAGRATLSAQMMSYWVEFAAHGAPGRGRGGDLPEWTPWSLAGSQFLVLDTPEGGGLRMLPDALTVKRVIAAVDADPRLPTQREKCAVFAAMARWGHGFSEKDYAGAGQKGCAEYPLEKRP